MNAWEWIATRLNRMERPVRFFLPEGGVSPIDAPGQPFHDPKADRVLFDTLGAKVAPGPSRKVIRLPGNINDPTFAAALVAAYREIAV